MRQSNALQRFLEKNARGGWRYIEQLLAHFGEHNSDYRLQRPEYLGGGKQPVVMSEVLNTAGETGGLPQGNMAGHGLSVGNVNQFKRKFKEHGYVFGIMSVLPRTAYQQGVPREFRRLEKLDYYFPEFAHLGEQEVSQDELYHDFTAAQDTNLNTVFGYQQRFAEYKYKNSTVHGLFRDDLDHWHMGRKFTSAPTLNNAFMNSDPTDRIFAVNEPTNEDVWAQLYHNLKAVRPMPFFANPSL